MQLIPKYGGVIVQQVHDFHTVAAYLHPNCTRFAPQYEAKKGDPLKSVCPYNNHPLVFQVYTIPMVTNPTSTKLPGSEKSGASNVDTYLRTRGSRTKG